MNKFAKDKVDAFVFLASFIHGIQICHWTIEHWALLWLPVGCG